MPDPNYFHPISSTRLSDVAVNQIKDLIEKGLLKPGDSLPPERELMKMLAVSRPSLREALRILEVLGFVEVQPGVGTFVADRSTLDPSSSWIEWLSEHRQEVIDLLEVRETLEPAATALATSRINDAELEALRNNLLEMHRCVELSDSEGAIQVDREFHEIIIRATRNSLLIKLGESIQDALMEARKRFFLDPNNILVSYQQHKEIVDEMFRKDPKAVMAAMMKHARNSREIVQRLSNDGDLEN